MPIIAYGNNIAEHNSSYSVDNAKDVVCVAPSEPQQTQLSQTVDSSSSSQQDLQSLVESGLSHMEQTQQQTDARFEQTITSGGKSQESCSRLVGTTSSETLTSHDLTKPRNEWTQEDFNFFVHRFNQSQSIQEIKKLTGQGRLEKIESICSRCDLIGLAIDKEKMKKYFLTETDERWRSPVIKVAKGDYLRISSKLAKQFGFELQEGQKFQFNYEISSEGKQILQLTLLQ